MEQWHTMSKGMQLPMSTMPGEAVEHTYAGPMAAETVHFLEAVPSLKSRAALTTAYAAGLRASEVASLRIADIDSERSQIYADCVNLPAC